LLVEETHLIYILKPMSGDFPLPVFREIATWVIDEGKLAVKSTFVFPVKRWFTTPSIHFPTVQLNQEDFIQALVPSLL